MRSVRPVVVPGVVVGVGDFGPDDFDDARAGFDEAAGEEAALAKGVAAVAVAEFFAFGGEVEGFAGAAGDDEVEGALVIFVEVVGGVAFSMSGMAASMDSRSLARRSRRMAKTSWGV
jgi:hypothetical protein